MMSAIIKIKKCIDATKHQFNYDENQSTPERTVYACIHCDEVIEVYEDSGTGA